MKKEKSSIKNFEKVLSVNLIIWFLSDRYNKHSIIITFKYNSIFSLNGNIINLSYYFILTKLKLFMLSLLYILSEYRFIYFV